MAFEIPDPGFDALEYATRKLQQANELENVIIRQFKFTYETFWGVNPNGFGGSLHTTEEMQQILEALPMATAFQVLTQASALVSYIDYAAPGVLEDRYKETAFAYEVVDGSIVLGDLKDYWLPGYAEAFYEIAGGGVSCAGSADEEVVAAE